MGENMNCEDDRHRQARELLPWYANGTLGESEAAELEAHLALCAECREELRFEQSIAAEIPASRPDLDVDAGWAEMRRRLEMSDAPSAVGGADNVVAFRPRSFFRRPVPLGWAVAAQAAAIVLVVGITQVGSKNPVAEPEYHALASQPSAAQANLLVMFRPDTQEAELRRILLANEAELIGGPNANGAYVLRVDPRVRAGALSQLHGDPHVTMAEPIDGNPK